jgi:Signal transduction histidine kinase
MNVSMVHRYKSTIKDLLKDALVGGLAGIGVSFTISLATGGTLISPYFWIGSAIFGFFIGIFITAGNVLLLSFIERIIPERLQLLSLELALSYIISVLIFYFATFLIKTTFYHVYGIPKWVELFPISLGVGVASMMITFFFIYATEKDVLLRLEKENRELAVIEERNRIARELHDSVSQNIFGISLNLKSLDYALEQDPARARQITKLLQGIVEETQTEMRLMIYELRPTALGEKGFIEALESMISLFRVRYNLDIHSDLKGDEILDSRKQLVLYRVIQESLSNIIKHAGTFKVKIDLNLREGKANLTIRDSGKGFIISEINEGEHLGLRGMKERVTQMKGEFTVESTIGKGTTVRVQL